MQTIYLSSMQQVTTKAPPPLIPSAITLLLTRVKPACLCSHIAPNDVPRSHHVVCNWGQAVLLTFS